MGVYKSWRCRIRLDDTGSVLPMIVVCVLLVIMMMMAVTAASAAFIAQRDLQSDCDAAAAAAASEVDPKRVEGGQAGKADLLPLKAEAVEAAVQKHQAEFYAGDSTLVMVAVVKDDVLSLRCHRVVKIPFGAFFGKGGGVEREALSQIQSPVSST